MTYTSRCALPNSHHGGLTHDKVTLKVDTATSHELGSDRGTRPKKLRSCRACHTQVTWVWKEMLYPMNIGLSLSLLFFILLLLLNLKKKLLLLLKKNHRFDLKGEIIIVDLLLLFFSLLLILFI
jgi:hypothetical protein